MLIAEQAEELAALESLDTGKPLSQARADVAVAARYFAFYASVVEGLEGVDDRCGHRRSCLHAS